MEGTMNAEREFWYLISGLVVGSRSVGRSVSKVVRFQFYMLMISQRERATSLHSNKLILGEANRPRTTQYVADEDDVMWWSTECNFDVLWSMNEKYKVFCTELWHGFHIFLISLSPPSLAFQPASQSPAHPPIDNLKKYYSWWQWVNRSRNQVRYSDKLQGNHEMLQESFKARTKNGINT